jgi:hypothetical protein
LSAAPGSGNTSTADFTAAMGIGIDKTGGGPGVKTTYRPVLYF